MAVGDVKSDLQSVANGNYLDIRPPSGEEWVIHNIYHSDDAELYFSNGTDEIRFSSHSGEGGWIGYFFHVTNSHYLRVKNVSGATALIGYDGVQTK